nr:MAG TPA: hypothetical protein [Caudoviricetes sp.]DAS89318.1 MAG TPA: hypothetical protein [Caudoviricetes sp.]
MRVSQITAHLPKRIYKHNSNSPLKHAPQLYRMPPTN